MNMNIYKMNYFNQENSPCKAIENISIIFYKKILKTRKKHKVSKHAQQQTVTFRLSRFKKSKKQNLITRYSSMPEISKCTKLTQPRNRSRHAIEKLSKYKQNPFQSKFIVNVVSEHRFDDCLNPFNHPNQSKWKMYRCQLNSQEETCCCCCNSDALFEVMKSLYECYRKRNCENCNCILCGHLQRQEKMLGGMRKSLATDGLDTASAKERIDKIKKAEQLLQGKTPAEKEKILKEMAKTRQPLPEGKTPSEKALIKKIRTELGLPPEPKTAADKVKMRKAEAAGIITPLEGKSLAQKKNILKAQAALGVPLPEGRTSSEKALIQKVKAEAGIPVKIPSEKLRKAKAAGLKTPLEGKTPEQKEKILRARAMKGLPLPEGQSPSEKKIINKVRADLGLPIEPPTQAIRDKHEQAAKAGLLQPLEGKTPAQKEKILQGLHDVGIPLPEGRTPSEKSLVARIKAGLRAALAMLTPSEQMRRAKAEGLLTPLKGKTPEQREKILRGLAMRGIPLPEGQSPSEKKLINKVRADLGLPAEPPTKAIRDKHEKAAKVGLLLPLEGKTPAQKEKILQGLHDMGIPLPVGRTPSEKSLIARIKAGPRASSAILAPSEQIRRAKAEGLLTPLKGKTPEQREKILRGLAMRGLPLPEGQSQSEKKLINKVRADLGLPIEPPTKSIREKHEQAAKAGLLHPLEGKTPAQKEKILQGLHDMGIPLPEGRTPSEKSLIAKIKAGLRAVLAMLTPSEQMRRAKAEGLLTPLKGKTPEQREKLLRGLAMRGIPLPEGQSPSEKKLINKVRADLGLPIEPPTKSIREKHEQAAKAGLLHPLEGKTPAQKENILQGLHDMGIPLPEGRTQSEKSLIAKIKAGLRAVLAMLTPSEQMRRAKAEGLLTPLKGKTPEQREKILRGLAMRGIPLPEGQSPSENKLINKVRADLGLPIEPPTKAIRDKHEQAAVAGLLLPLEGKTPAQKEKILQGLHDMGIPLPVGRTPSEKSLIARIKAGPRAASVILAPSEQIRRAKAEGLLTPLKGKTPEQRDKILRGLAMRGIPLPEGQSPSEKKLINKVRADLGLPIEPPTKSIREKHEQAAKAGLLHPLEGKTPAQKEKIVQGLHDMGIPLPVGRTPSEKSLIARIKAGPRAASAILAPSEQMRRAKAEGLLTPLKGKTPEQREKILRGLAMRGIPLPVGQSPSEKKLINKVRADLGLPIEPPTKSIREKHEQAAKAGLLHPLEGKTPAQEEKIVQGLHDMGIPLPVGRTPSEKSLIARIMASPHPPLGDLAPSERMRRAKAAGFLTPLEGKTPAQKEKILKGLAMHGIPLPEGKSPSEKKLIDNIRVELGLPPEPKTPAMKDKYAKAAEAGLLQPLEGKTPKEKEKILRGLANLGIPLPEGRTPSEKAIIQQIKGEPRRSLIGPPSAKAITKSARLRDAKAAGFLTPLEGKTPEQKEKILRGLAKHGLPLPEGKTASVKKIVDKVRAQLGLPPEPQTSSIREKYAKAQAAGIITPLEGKSPAQKEKNLRAQAAMGLPPPVGRTSSEKALITKIKGEPSPSITTDKIQKAKAAGLLTPLTGKSPEQREKILKGLATAGLPLPEGKTASEKALINKMKKEFGIPDRTPSEKLRKAKAAGLLTPLEGKTPAQKEKILRGRAAAGLPLPIGKTPSERALIQKIKDDTGHVTPSPSERLRKAKAAGLITPLKGKTPSLKEKILKDMIAAGVPIPEGETPSEKELINRLIAGPPSVKKSHSVKMKQAKAAGLLTPLKGKTPEQKEKILRGLIKVGLPLPEPKTASEKDLIDRMRQETGLPPEPKTPSLREKYKRAEIAGLITPLEGKTPAEKEKVLQKLYDAGIPLPKGRTPSEKSMIKRLKGGMPVRKTPSERLKAAKAAGLLTPLEGKTPAQKEKILKGLVKTGVPLPKGKTQSEKDLINKIRQEMGLPPEPKTPSLREKMQKAQAAGIITPLEGKTPLQKTNILKALVDAGIPLPEGRTPSEKSLIAKIKAETKPQRISSEKIRKAKAAGLLTPLEGKTPKEKERVMRGLAEHGLPLPEAKTASEKQLAAKIRKELGLPPAPKTLSMKQRHEKAAAAGVLVPLEGLLPAEKEKVLKAQADLGLALPEGRTPSEKLLIAKIKDALIAKFKGEPKKPKSPSEKLRKAKAAGLLTPLEGKTPAEKERIMKGLAEHGLPLPEAKTTSEKKLAAKIRKELGLPPEPETPSMKERHDKAATAGVLVPLEGLSPAEKEKVLKAQADLGLALPEGRTPSEKLLIAKIKDALLAKIKGEPKKLKSPSEKLRKAKAAGLLTPLEGKTPAEKERIMKGLAEHGLPLPEAKTASEKKLAAKIRKELGLPPEPETPSMKERHDKAAAAGVLVPLEGLSPAEKEKVLKAQADLGLALPEGRTPSEKSLIAKIKEALLAKIKGEPKKPNSPSEKLQKAKAAGLLTPLEGKTPAEKERIMKGLVEHGLPLPEAKTASEKKLAAKIRKELGLPPEPETPSKKERHDKAAAAGVLVPLEGLSPAEKERVLKAQADLGLPLPEGRTASEKGLIAKIKAAKAGGLLMPLDGKTPAEKEKILRGLAESGMPLPEGKTPSEKSLIHKIRTELGIPPPATTASEKSVISKAKAAGLFTPITGKSPAEKERILKGLAEAGLPLPVGKTASEKGLIKKIRAEAGLPLEPTPSEKMGKIKKKKKKVSVAKKLAEGIVAEEFQDIIKTTCDRGCGCDKKKIKFKHSYVKIKVISPDISSFCDCPVECIPGVKSGTFIDKDGIKVIVGRAIGIPSYVREYNNHLIPDEIMSNTDYRDKHTGHLSNHSKSSKHKVCSFEKGCSKHETDSMLNASTSDVSSSRPYNTESENIYLQNSTPPYEGRASKSNRITESWGLQLSYEIYRNPTVETKSTASSFNSILVIKSETSLSLDTSTSNSVDTMSVMSDMDNSITSNSTHYSGYQSIDNQLSISSLDGPPTSASDELINQPVTIWEHKTKRNINAANSQREHTILRISQTNLNFGNKKIGNSKQKSETDEPVVLFNRLPSKLDVSKILDKILTKKRFSGASSIFLIVPTSDQDDAENSSNSFNSFNGTHSTETHYLMKNTSQVDPKPELRTSSPTQRNLHICGKGKKFYMQEILSSNDTETMFQNKSLEVLRHVEMTKNKYCQINTPNEMAQVITPDEMAQINTPNKMAQMLEKTGKGIGTDTTADRPCCCRHKESSTTFDIQNFSSKDHYAANVTSRQITPLFLKGTKSSFFCSPGSLTPSAVAPVMPCEIPTCSDFSSCHVPSNHSRHRCRPHRSKDEHVYNSEIPLPCDRSSEGYPKCYGICSTEDVDEIMCESKVLNKKTVPQKIEIRPCKDNYLVSEPEPVQTPVTKSIETITDIKEKPTQKEVKETLSSPQTKKTKFCDVTDNPSSIEIISSKTSRDNTDPMTPENLNKMGPQSYGTRQQSQRMCHQLSYQASRKPKKSKHTTGTGKSFASKASGTCEGSVTYQTESRQPSPQASRKPKKTKDTTGTTKPSASKADCTCQDGDCPVIMTKQISNQQPSQHASRKPKKSKYPTGTAKCSSSKVGCTCQGVESPGNITHQIFPGSSANHKSSKLASIIDPNDHQPQDQVSPKSSNEISKLIYNIKKSFSHKIDCAYNDKSTKNQVGQKVYLKNSESPKTRKKKAKVMSPENVCLCNDEISVIKKGQKALSRPKDLKGPKTSSKGLENRPPLCSCIDDQVSKKDEKIMCTYKEPKPKKKSVTIFDSKLQSGVQPMPEQLSQLQTTSNIEKALDLQPIFGTEEAPHTQPISDTDNASHFQSMSEAELVHQPQHMPQVELNLPPEVIPEGHLYEGIGLRCGCTDKEEIIRVRSDIALSTSGFKARKKKKLQKRIKEPQTEIELDFEDAVRYYASLNPELVRHLMQQQNIPKILDSESDEMYKGKKGKKLKKKREKERKEKEKPKKKSEKAKKKRKYSSDDSDEDNEKNKGPLEDKSCDCSYGPVPPPIPYETTTSESPAELVRLYPKGFKFSVRGKGSASPGLSGLRSMACFDITQESYMSW